MVQKSVEVGLAAFVFMLARVRCRVGAASLAVAIFSSTGWSMSSLWPHQSISSFGFRWRMPAALL